MIKIDDKTSRFSVSVFYTRVPIPYSVLSLPPFPYM